MNIAHIVPQSVVFPLLIHNGRYEWVLRLAQLQQQAGHTVTIYCNASSTLDAITTAGIHQVGPDKKHNNIDTFRLAFSQPHDLYHSHLDSLHYEVSHLTNKPIVFTQHWWPYEQTVAAAQLPHTGNVWAVPPTNYMYQFDISHGIQSKGYIHHGIDLKLFRPLNMAKNNRLLYVGRISPQKKIEDALFAAEQSGLGLDIIGKITAKNQKYWQSLLPRIDGTLIKYHGAKNQTELKAFYSSALGVLCTFDRTEAFGLTAIEAQACGTPVIMQRGGSRKELIQENKTGFLYDSHAELVHSVHKLCMVKAEDCIAFASNFDSNKMSDHYLKLYSELLT